MYATIRLHCRTHWHNAKDFNATDFATGFKLGANFNLHPQKLHCLWFISRLCFKSFVARNRYCSPFALLTFSTSVENIDLSLGVLLHQSTLTVLKDTFLSLQHLKWRKDEVFVSSLTVKNDNCFESPFPPYYMIISILLQAHWGVTVCKIIHQPAPLSSELMS